MSRHLQRKRWVRQLVLAVIPVSLVVIATALWMSTEEIGLFAAISAAIFSLMAGAFWAYVYDQNRFRWGLLCAGVAGTVLTCMFFIRRLSGFFQGTSADGAPSVWSLARETGGFLFFLGLCVLTAVIGWERLRAT